MSDGGTSRGIWGAAVIGGIAGALLMAILLVVAGPRLFGERIVREALTAHPEILVETSDALRDRQYAPALAASRRQIETPFHSSWKGAAKPDVTLAYYYDYACGYCRRSSADLDRLVAEDKGVRVVYHELPILGPNSLAASRAALAASKAGRFAAFYDAMYATSANPSEATVTAAAAIAGVPAMPPSDPEQEAALKANFAVAGQLGATGTPLFIVGDRVMNSAVGYDMLKQAVAAARKAKG